MSILKTQKGRSINKYRRKPRRRKKPQRRKRELGLLIAIALVVGICVGASVTYLFRKPSLHLEENELYSKSITIVGIDEGTREGTLATVVVELRAGSGRLLIDIPPYENVNTQEASWDARLAVEDETGYQLDAVDIIIGLEDLFPEETISGPSASAAIAVVMAAAVRESIGVSSFVRDDVVVSAQINQDGRLFPVGEIQVKYEKVRAEGGFNLFVTAASQQGLVESPGLPVGKASNLHGLLELVLE
jgi:predicted S18 family serine protease